MAVSVADLAKYYADNPPTQRDPLAELEARLDALSKPSYRSPFKFEPSLGVRPFGTTGYGTIGTYGSVSEFLKATIPDVASLYGTYPADSMSMLEPTPLSELLAKNYKPSPVLMGAAKVAYDAGIAFNRRLETWQPAMESFSVFLERLTTGLQTAHTGIMRWVTEASKIHPLEAQAYEVLEALKNGQRDRARQFLEELRIWPGMRIHAHANARLTEHEAHSALWITLDYELRRRSGGSRPSWSRLPLANAQTYLKVAVLNEVRRERNRHELWHPKPREERKELIVYRRQLEVWEAAKKPLRETDLRSPDVEDDRNPDLSVYARHYGAETWYPDDLPEDSAVFPDDAIVRVVRGLQEDPNEKTRRLARLLLEEGMREGRSRAEIKKMAGVTDQEFQSAIQKKVKRRLGENSGTHG